MPDQSYETRIEKDLRPSYYDKFHCLAKDCRISCCKNWRIWFGKKDYLSMKRQDGSPELNERIEHGICRIRKDADDIKYYAEFAMKDGICPLLREDHLCELQIEKGHDALPEVCRTFPRTNAYMPTGYLERSLSLACEGVLKLLWELPEGIEFCSDPLPRQRQRNFTFPDMQNLYAYFQDIRSWCIDMLQDRRYPLPERIMRMGTAFQKLCDGERDISRWIAEARILQEEPNPFLPSREERSQLLPLFLSNNLHLLLKSGGDLARDGKNFVRKILKAFLRDIGGEMESGLSFSLTEWLTARGRYEEQWGDREYFMENVMVSIYFHLYMPALNSPEEMWKSFVNFCNLYAFFRFMAVTSCCEGFAGDRDALFEHIVFASRMLLHNGKRQQRLKEEFFEHDSTTLAHMAILLSD